MAFTYLMMHNPLSKEHISEEWQPYLARQNALCRDVVQVVRYLQRYRGWEEEEPVRREFKETVHGVCLAEYQFDEGRRKGELEDLTLYPVTGMVRSEREYFQKWEQNTDENRNDEAERFVFEEEHDGGHTAKSAIRMTWHHCE